MKEVIGVTLVEGRDDALIDAVRNLTGDKASMSGRIRDLATAGLKWEAWERATQEADKEDTNV